MMEATETIFTPVVANSEQLVLAYPNLFEKINVDILPIYLEKEMKDKEGFTKEERLFLMPTGVLSVSATEIPELESIWEISKEDKDFLSELNRYAGERKKD
jgi:hypothetical protein